MLNSLAVIAKIFFNILYIIDSATHYIWWILLQQGRMHIFSVVECNLRFSTMNKGLPFVIEILWLSTYASMLCL